MLDKSISVGGQPVSTMETLKMESRLLVYQYIRRIIRVSPSVGIIQSTIGGHRSAPPPLQTNHVLQLSSALPAVSTIWTQSEKVSPGMT